MQSAGHGRLGLLERARGENEPMVADNRIYVRLGNSVVAVAGQAARP